MKKVIIAPDIVQEMIGMYKSGLSVSKIGKHFDYSRELIRKTLAKNRLVLRKLHQINHKHIINDHLFDNIDTEEKAYFLGFLFADGNVHKKCNAIVLKLHEKDKYILVRFSHMIYGFEHLLRSENNVILKFSSYDMKLRLIELGCVPAKSLILSWPEKLQDPEMIRHFIRGYFDGDGCITSNKNDYRANIISTHNFCEAVKSLIFKVSCIDGKISHKKNDTNRGNLVTASLEYAGNRRVAIFMEWLYKDSTIYLIRKHDRFMDLKRHIAEIDNRHKICSCE